MQIQCHLAVMSECYCEQLFLLRDGEQLELTLSEMWAEETNFNEDGLGFLYLTTHHSVQIGRVLNPILHCPTPFPLLVLA